MMQEYSSLQVVLKGKPQVLGPSGKKKKKKKKKAAISFVMATCPSVYRHGTTRLSVDEFSWNLKFRIFTHICRPNQNLFKIGQK